MWLPIAPQNRINLSSPGGLGTITGAGDGSIGALQQIMLTPSVGVFQSTEIPLIGDNNEAVVPGIAGATMADFAFGYSLQRAVGSIFCSVEQQLFIQGENVPYNFMCTAGLMVRRVNDAGDPNTFSPPDIFESMSDPWIWRRSWALTNQPQAQSSGGYFPYPSNNAAYGSIREGSHIDAKTRRTIKQEERLFLTLMTTCVGPLTDPPALQEGYGINWMWNIRFFGRVFQTSGNRRNASR